MTPNRARLTLFALVAIFLATAVNALFLQDPSRSRFAMKDGPSTAISITQFPPIGQVSQSVSLAPQSSNAKPASNAPKLVSRRGLQDSQEPKLDVALQRELKRKGYANGADHSMNELRYDILAYEYDSGLPLTGKASQDILKRLIFDLNPAPKGAFADRAESDAKLVLATQKMLLELGFFSGNLSGRVDVWTANALKAFERHRNIAITGRLSQATLFELISYSGQPLLYATG